eukprot:scaffold412280_cov39-Prasinocladus_malaysianus.AAC.1
MLMMPKMRPERENMVRYAPSLLPGTGWMPGDDTVFNHSQTTPGDPRSGAVAYTRNTNMSRTM